MTPNRARLEHRTKWLFVQRPDLGEELLCFTLDMGRDEWMTGSGWSDGRLKILHDWLDDHNIPYFYMGCYPSVQMLHYGLRTDTPKARIIRRRDWMLVNGLDPMAVGMDMSSMEYMDRDFDPHLDLLHRKLTSLEVPELYIEDFLYPVHWQSDSIL